MGGSLGSGLSSPLLSNNASERNSGPATWINSLDLTAVEAFSTKFLIVGLTAMEWALAIFRCRSWQNCKINSEDDALSNFILKAYWLILINTISSYLRMFNVVESINKIWRSFWSGEWCEIKRNLILPEDRLLFWGVCNLDGGAVIV